MPQFKSSEYDRTREVDLSSLEKLPRQALRSPVPVTIVVCARNREGMIGRCLDSIIRGNPSEIIVVDGNSTDGTADIARAKGAMVVSDDGAGLGAARQQGACLARNRYVIFVDSDVVVEPDTFQQLVDEAQEKNYDALQADLRTLSIKPSYWQSAERWRRQMQTPQGVATVLGCQITLMRRDLLMKVGFDPAFKGAAEDFDFSFRARAAGAVIAYSAVRTVAYHEDRSTLREFVAQRIWYGRGVARMLTRYGRNYLSEAASQVDTALGGTRFNVRYFPYISVSWSATALGVTLELLRVACDPALRKRLSLVQMVQDRADAC